MIVLNTSDAECTASEIIAPDDAKIPAASFPAESRTFTRILTFETCIAVCSILLIRCSFLLNSPIMILLNSDCSIPCSC